MSELLGEVEGEAAGCLILTLVEKLVKFLVQSRYSLLVLYYPSLVIDKYQSISKAVYPDLQCSIVSYLQSVTNVDIVQKMIQLAFQFLLQIKQKEDVVYFMRSILYQVKISKKSKKLPQKEDEVNQILIYVFSLCQHLGFYQVMSGRSSLLLRSIYQNYKE